MRYSFVAVTAVLLGLSSAQGVGSLPKCAQECVAPFTSGSEIAGCSGIDIGCICSSGVFLEKTACCLNEKCGPEDQARAIAFAGNICATADPPVEVPSEIVCSGVTAGASATGEPTATTETEATQTDSTTTTETTGSETTPAPSGDETTSSDATGTETESPATSSGAAVPAFKAGTGVVGGIVAALAFL